MIGILAWWASAAFAVDADGDTWHTPADCNDANPSINPGAAEVVGNNVDNNCDGVEDCFPDADNDGARLTTTDPGGANNDADCNDPNEGATADPLDCSDANPAINPAATEIKGDGVDQNCDTDESCWPDADNDGDRAATGSIVSADTDCSDPGEGLTSDPVDCDDANAARSSTAVEVVGDNVDSNCNGVEDCFTDADNDGARTTVVDPGGANNDADCNDPNEGATADPLDCSDANPAINPAATEIKGDGVDQNCDTDESCWPDADNDGDRAATGSIVSADTDCSDPGEGLTSDPVDCDDANAARSSTAVEVVGDNVDSNCNGVEDCFPDLDNDGARTTVVDPGGVNNDADCSDAGEGLATDALDCNDVNAAVHPAAAEVVGDNVDSNCNGTEDCYTDLDNDGARTSAIDPGGANNDLDCNDANEGVSADALDCNDANAAIHPAAAEVAGDNVDGNCNGVEDCFTDLDNDGARTTVVDLGGANNDADCADAGEGLATDALDCNDVNAAVNPAAAEVVGDNVDSNCNGTEDCYTDLDNDGARTSTIDPGGANNDLDCNDANEGVSADALDCNDANAAIHPAAAEVAGDNVDGNCNGTEDCFTDLDNDGARTTVVDPGGANNDADCADAGEGLATDALDCNDANASVNPAALEGVGDNVDSNCNGVEDCFTDLDNDGARTTVVDVGGANNDLDCNDPAEGVAADPIDCNDANAAINPAASEIKGDGIDQNCDTDESCWPDTDLDGHRAASGAVASSDTDCDDAGEGSTADPLDCDDTDGAVNASAAEVVGDGVDSDCDGTETCWADVDNDGARSTATLPSSDLDCTDAGEATAAAAIDCADADATRRPGALETVGNGVDNDCDGDEVCYLDDDNDDYRSTATVNSVDGDCADADEALATAGLDCADTSAAVHPGVADVCGNGVDDDCSGVASDHGGLSFADDDGDGLDFAQEHTFPECVLDDCAFDTDQDGLDDGTEVAIGSSPCVQDTDGDGLDDLVELGLAPPAPDLDLDGHPDFDDADDDGDGIPTAVELATPDADGDGVGSWYDLDSDGDGWSDADEWTEALGADHDTDGDGDADFVDADSDDDTLPDAAERDADTDGDGLRDRVDDDDDGDCVPTRFEAGRDSDGDGVGDEYDDDDDDDGAASCAEDADGDGDATDDDTDGDGVADFQDDDDDGDGVPTLLESCSADSDGIPAYRDLDSDDDGFPDAEEAPGGVLVDTDGDGAPDGCDLDSDADRVTDAYERHADTDGDGPADRVDDDDDGDGLASHLECGSPLPCDADPRNDDADADGLADYLDADDDDDGVASVREVPWGDTDQDGVDDRVDPDDDDDGVATIDEEAGDTDGDGTDDVRDPDDDGDGLLTADEGAGAVDHDGDGTPDPLDADDDGDDKDTRCEVSWLPPGAHLEPDTDQDGLPDGAEWGEWDGAGPVLDPSSCDEPVDTDRDGTPDVLDDDDDDDGLLTYLELSPTELFDRSADDDCFWRDLDADGAIDPGEALPSVLAGDGVPDHRDTDSDNDGVPDGAVDPDADALETFGEDVDSDGLDNVDDCDSTGCAGDSDGDGWSNADETRACCRVVEATGDAALFDGLDPSALCAALDAGDTSSCGCALTVTRDHDLDGTLDPDELGDLEAPQPDEDADGLPDVLDGDDDGDGLPSRVENLRERATDCTLGQWEASQVRVTNVCDLGFRPEFLVDVLDWGYRCDEPTGATTFVLCAEPSNLDAADATEPLNPGALLPDADPNTVDPDDDGDGTPTAVELGRPNPDVDCDGLENWFDRADLDGDCADADGDGLSNDTERRVASNPYSTDSDDDGRPDRAEFGPGPTPVDSDGDGAPDLLDDDDDDDGVPTAEEGAFDTDGDGDPDHLDVDSDDDGLEDGAEDLSDDDCDGRPARYDAVDDPDGCTPIADDPDDARDVDDLPPAFCGGSRAGFVPLLPLLGWRWVRRRRRARP
jgi:hypothetical protein